MPHCTGNYPFYLGKFLLGLTGMIYVYCKYLQEKHFRCLCPMRDRAIKRNQGKVREDRCYCAAGMRNKRRYACDCRRLVPLPGALQGTSKVDDRGYCTCSGRA